MDTDAALALTAHWSAPVRASAVACAEEITSVLAIVQAGYSLGSALKSFVQDFRHCAADVDALVRIIDATLGVLQDLKLLIVENEHTRAWSPGGLLHAQKCVIDCHEALDELSILVCKTGLDLKKQEVKVSDFDPGTFSALEWAARTKRKVEGCKLELKDAKGEIDLAIGTYQLKLGQRTGTLTQTEAENIYQKCKEAFENRREKGITRRGKKSQRTREYEQRHVKRDCSPLTKERIQILLKEEQVQQEQQKREAKEAKTMAVEEWKAQRLEELAKEKSENDAKREQLRGSLSASGMQPKQIEGVVDSMYPLRASDNIDYLVFPKNAEASPEDRVLDEANAGGSWLRKRLHVFTNRGKTSGKAKDTKSVLNLEIVQKAISATGSLRPLDFWVLYYDGRTWLETVGLEPWLLRKMSDRCKALTDDRPALPSVWNVLSEMPINYRGVVMSYMGEIAIPDQRTLVHLEGVYHQTSIRRKRTWQDILEKKDEKFPEYDSIHPARVWIMSETRTTLSTMIALLDPLDMEPTTRLALSMVV
ncbi:hypothetical protein FH972_022874 [Carpinus fangiana]|uniref:Uncharacterized protein n=1 Tax=Carpinus fangiana TaxID=176857 RepID=A0A5N6KTJ8_9ROSI|nr:hypothetical protein FH972_022874 [Carpinus fangiana]